MLAGVIGPHHGRKKVVVKTTGEGVALRRSTGALASDTPFNFSDEWTSIAVTM